MKSTLASFLVIAVAAVAVAATAFAQQPAIKISRFSFKVPDGWTDKSVPDTRTFYVLALDEPNNLLFNAKVAPGADPVTPEFLDKYAGDAQKSVAKRLKGAALKIVDKKLVNVAGRPAARFVFELPPPPDAEVAQDVRQVQYYIPAVDQHAILTFSAPRKDFEKFAPLFDNTAKATLVAR